MGVLDWIFGTRDDNEDAYAKRLEEAASRQPTMDDVPAWNRPMSSGPNDQWTGVEDELGRKQYRTMTGQTYFLDWQPDQRTTRMKVEDDVLPVVQDYIENPTLPTASQVGNFAMDVAKESYDTLANTVRGQGTLGDVLGIATGVGGAGLAVSRGAADGAVGMFLNSRAKGVDLDALKRAEDMTAQGVDRDTIWKDTGWGQFNGEWLTEIDDSMSEIKAQAPYKERGTETRYITVPGELSQQERVSLRVDAQRKALEIRQQLERGEITQDQAVWQAKQIQDALAMNLRDAAPTTKAVEVNKPAPPLEYKGKLDQVLFHDSLYDAIPDGVNMPTAEAARRSADSAGVSKSYLGVYYPQINSDTLLENKDRSRINAFRPTNAPKAPAQLSKAQADAVWSTTLHETQHFMDDVMKSTSGVGSNTTAAKEVIQKANMAVYNAEQAIKATPELETVRQSLESITGVKIRPFTAYDWLDQVLVAASDADPDKAAQYLRMFVENTISNGAADKVEDVVKYITSPDSNIASVIDKISQVKNSKAYRVSLMSDFQAYQHEGGEVKSRLTQERRKLTAEQRRERPFWYDLPAVGADERNIYSQQSPNLDVPLGSIEDAPASLGYRSSSNIDELVLDADTNALDVLGIDAAMKEEWRGINKVDQKQRRIPQIEDAAKALVDGSITSAEYRELVQSFHPIVPFSSVPNLPTVEEIASALDSNKVAKGIIGVNKGIENGTYVSSRLDIPAYENYDTWVVSLHDGTGDSLGGKSIGYAQTAVLKDVKFGTVPKAAANIASGKPKTTIARIFGSWENADPESVHALAQQYMNDPEWVQVGMNPFRHSYFYDKATGEPVVEAAEMIQVGPLVLARGVRKASPDDPMFRIDPKNPNSRTFSKGGLVTH